jgi:hypothetical protein
MAEDKKIMRHCWKSGTVISQATKDGCRYENAARGFRIEGRLANVATSFKQRHGETKAKRGM